jgi:hypothetical protein
MILSLMPREGPVFLSARYHDVQDLNGRKKARYMLPGFLVFGWCPRNKLSANPSVESCLAS